MASKNFDAKGIITTDDTDLRKSVSKVLSADQKREKSRYQADLQGRKARKALSLEESIIQVESAASDSLASYPGSNGLTGDRQYPVADSRYYSDDPYKQPANEPNVSNEKSSKEAMFDLMQAGERLARIYSRIVDDRARWNASDRDAVRSFVRNLSTALLND